MFLDPIDCPETALPEMNDLFFPIFSEAQDTLRKGITPLFDQHLTQSDEELNAIADFLESDCYQKFQTESAELLYDQERPAVRMMFKEIKAKLESDEVQKELLAILNANGRRFHSRDDEFVGTTINVPGTYLHSFNDALKEPDLFCRKRFLKLLDREKYRYRWLYY